MTTAYRVFKNGKWYTEIRKTGKLFDEVELIPLDEKDIPKPRKSCLWKPGDDKKNFDEMSYEEYRERLQFVKTKACKH